MHKIYTHVWKKGDKYQSEDTCGNSLDEAIELLNDYAYAWHNKGWEYSHTYEDDLRDDSVNKLDLSENIT